MGCLIYAKCFLTKASVRCISRPRNAFGSMFKFCSQLWATHWNVQIYIRLLCVIVYKHSLETLNQWKIRTKCQNLFWSNKVRVLLSTIKGNNYIGLGQTITKLSVYYVIVERFAKVISTQLTSCSSSRNAHSIQIWLHYIVIYVQYWAFFNRGYYRRYKITSQARL